ncbi:hypothetical protein D1007_57117 [Hordeum vulgare]|nr:hypothetical protein D1007_57117 [Hordeum vulgare]
MKHPKRAKKGGHEVVISAPPPRNIASPSRLFILNGSLQKQQKVAIGDISFVDVLDIGTRTMKGDFVKFFMKFYDPELSQLVIPERWNIPVDVASVERTWGLPRGGEKVAYKIESGIVRLFYEMYNISSGAAPTVAK